jgi:hypothetical protein
MLATLAGLVAVTLLPQAAVATPAAAGVRSATAAAARPTLAQLMELERQAEAAEEQRLLAEGPIDDFELNRMLIQDLADYDEDAEVRAAAAQVLTTNDPEQFANFLDQALAIYRAAADQRRKELATVNRGLVQQWSEEGGPIVRQRAAAALATNNDAKIADFVAIGRAAARAADEQATLNAAQQDQLIKTRVEQIVAAGGYEVSSAGQAALDTGDPVVIAAFYTTGYKEASARDTTAQTQIEQALAARNKAVADLADLATRATQAANARVQIITASVSATKSLTITANSMGLTNRYAKDGDAIYAADLPIRKAGGKTHTADLVTLRVNACNEAATTARNAGQVSAQAGVAETAAGTLTRTGLSNGIAWAEVMQAQKDAGTAARQAAETACSATQATEAASKALDADRNATVQADNAVKYRESAQREAAAAAKLADQAEKLAAAARAAEQDAHRQRLRAEQDARDAWAKADEARIHYQRAIAQRDVARQQMAIAVAQQSVALNAAKSAVAQQDIAAGKGAIARAAADRVTKTIEEFDQVVIKSQNASAQAKKAIETRNRCELESAALHQEAAAKAGTAAGDEAARQAAIIDAQLPGARAAANSAQTAADTASAAAENAAAAARAAAAAAAAAAAEARAAATAAAGARRDAADAAAAAGRAISDAQKADGYARESVNVARAAINHAAKSKADADLTRSSADNAMREAAVASFQSRVAGRAATNARVSALGIADPAAKAIDVASAYAETDNDAAMAIDIANSAILIGATQSAAADKHAADADAAAVHAAQEALRAQGQIKLAYEAAQQAAADAARAIRASKAAIDAAIGAAKEARGTIAAAADASRAAQKATSYANGAQRAAVQAGHDAAVARQASVNAKFYSGRADAAAKNADKIAKQIESAGLQANKFADSMKITAAEMTRIAKDTRDVIPQLEEMEEAEKKARATSWMKTWKEAWDKKIRESDMSDGLKNFYYGEGEAAIGVVGGLWLVGLCEIGHPTDPSQSEVACDLVKEGIKELIKNPGSLIHLDEWRNGEYAKALGMTVVDVATMDLPKIGKITAGINIVKDGLAASVAKLLSGELLTGLKNFGAQAIEAGLKKLGAIKLTKLIELDVDLPKKLTFSSDEIAVLKLTIDTKGFPAVEKALKGITDDSVLEALNKLLKQCGNSFTPNTRVLLADGTTKPIAGIRVGDKVLATDPETGRTRGEPVTALHRNLDTELADVTVATAGGRRTIRTTQHHPFWNATDGEWTDAGDLRPRDELRAHQDKARVARVHRYTGARFMHNLTVADLHTYYVMAGPTAVLVHNVDCVAKQWVWPREGVTAPGTDTQGPLPPTAGLRPGEALTPETAYHYVVRTDGSLRIISTDKMFELEGSAGHTSLADYQPVIMAGTLETDAAGKIKLFDNHSGHYMPGMDKAYIELQVAPGYAELEIIAETAFKKFGLPDPEPGAWSPFDPTDWSAG